jgi:hypothetical protein
MQTTYVILASYIEDDILEWYKAATPGDILYIVLPQDAWAVCLTRHYCGVIWQPPGQQAAKPGLCRDVMRILSGFLHTPRQWATQPAAGSRGRHGATRDRKTEARAACPRS